MKMCKVEILRALVNQRLTAAVEEICIAFERTIAEYEEELCRTKEENERQRQLLEVFKNPQVVLHRADASEEDLPPERQEWRNFVEQKMVEQEAPKPLHVKEEEEDRSISHFDRLEDFAVTCVPVKSEDDEDEAQSDERKGVEPPSCSSIDRHFGGSQSDSLFAPLSDSDDTTSHSPDADDEDAKADNTHHTDNRHFKCSECDKSFNDRRNLKRHIRTHTGEKPYMCSVCGKRVSSRASLNAHTTIHTGEKPFSCSVCGKGFGQRQGWKRHMRTHTDEKPFMCLVCGRRFCRKEHLTVHTRIHTGEKPFSCSVCGKCFIQNRSFKAHICLHTGQKHFSC
uniref:zinc finger protein 570-like n=1 Tax=Doryrhamphus excisus TaxID=161450 RepID=UPI0025AE21FA|nr:zinc finger protein 570-like [Doryrhamphus excisus]